MNVNRATHLPDTQRAHDALQRVEEYLAALDEAGQAMDRARRIVPDHGLDHGVVRLRAMLLEGVAELERMRAELKP